jgi:hypothetical protein
MSTTFNSVSTLAEPVELAAIAPATSPEIAKPDFISNYADFADVFEMPREVHEWVAVQLIASVLNGNVDIEWGAVTYSLDLWVLLLSGSGQGRNTATDVALKVLKAAEIQGRLHKATWGSKAAFYQQIAEHPHGLYVWPELSVILSKLKDPAFGGVKEWLTDRYDNQHVPDGITYRQTGKKRDTPPIIFNEAPRTNILATSSSDWFINSLEQEDTTGGFIPRWLLKQIGKSERLIPKPIAPDPTLLPVLGDQLALIAELKGKADLSKVEQLYSDWYCATYRKFEEQPNSALAVPFFNRLRGELLKLAVIFEASQSGTLQVTQQAFDRAAAAASDAEETIFTLIPTGMSREGSEVEKMSEKIRSAGPEGITQSELTRSFQGWKPWERAQRLQTLLESARVHYLTEPTKGRNCTRYVHQEHYAGTETCQVQQS